MTQELTTTRLSPKLHTALQDILSSPALQAARQERLQAIVDERKKVRARLKDAGALENELVKKEAEVASFEPKVLKAQLALNALFTQFELLRTERWSLEHQRDMIRNSVFNDLWELADPRARNMRFWLMIMRDFARGAFQVEEAVERKAFGGFVNKVTTNLKQIQAAIDAVDKGKLELDQLVMQADVLDFGPALTQIAANVRKAFEPLQLTGAVGRELPELDLA